MTPKTIYRDLTVKAKNDAFDAITRTTDLFPEEEKVLFTLGVVEYLCLLAFSKLYNHIDAKDADYVIDCHIDALKQIKLLKGKMT